MNRRRFLAAAATAATLKADTKSKLLLPTDTPDELGFRLMWYTPATPIDESAYQLKVTGLVEKPQSLDIAALRKFNAETQSSRMKCVQCWSARTEWRGFRGGSLLDLVKPLKTAHAIKVDCADKWYEYFPIEDILSNRFLFALDMAGKPLSPKHGAPLRVIDPRRYGYKSAKLITSIEFVEEGKGSMACDIGPYYSATGEIKAGYDHPLDIGPNERRKIAGGEITDY